MLVEEQKGRIIKGNGGEWGELICFLLLLTRSSIIVDQDGAVRGTEWIVRDGLKYFPLYSAVTTTFLAKDKLPTSGPRDRIYVEKDGVRSVIQVLNMKDRVDRARKSMFDLWGNKSRTFEVPEMESLMKDLGIPQIKAGCSEKSDLIIKLTKQDESFGYSVKTVGVSNSSLINASNHTRMIYSATIPVGFGTIKSGPEGLGLYGSNNKVLCGKTLLYPFLDDVEFDRAWSPDFARGMMSIPGSDQSPMEKMIGVAYGVFLTNGRSIGLPGDEATTRVKEIVDILSSLKHSGYMGDQWRDNIMDFLVQFTTKRNPSGKLIKSSTVDGGRLDVGSKGKITMIQHTRDDYALSLYRTAKFDQGSYTTRNNKDINCGVLYDINARSRSAKFIVPMLVKEG